MLGLATAGPDARDGSRISSVFCKLVSAFWFVGGFTTGLVAVVVVLGLA